MDIYRGAEDPHGGVGHRGLVPERHCMPSLCELLFYITATSAKAAAASSSIKEDNPSAMKKRL